MGVPATNTIGGVVGGLLERGYSDSAGRVLAAVTGSTLDDVVKLRLDQLEEEARRLDEAGLKLEADNPVLRALMADLDPVMRQNARLLDNAAGEVQANGIDVAAQATRQLALPGLSDAALQEVGVFWNVPDPEAVNRVIGYVDSTAWAQQIGKYPQEVMDVINNQAIRGIAEGWNPLKTVRAIRDMTENTPVVHANTLMRTLHLTTFREGSAINQLANSDILTAQIRIAVLDDRTCMSCIALHGTRMAVGERVDDHHRGRCTSITEVVGFPREVSSGEEWFNSLSEERQLTIAGPGKLELLQSGKATLRDFVEEYTDPVFGRMFREASIKSLGLPVP